MPSENDCPYNPDKEHHPGGTIEGENGHKLCQCEIERRRDAKIERLFDQSQVYQRYRGNQLSDFTENMKPYQKRAFKAARKFARNYEEHTENGDGFYFHGEYGTGKTDLSCRLALELISEAVPSLVIKASKILETLRPGGDDAKRQERREEFETVEFLVIDDFLKHKNSEWVAETMNEIIDERYVNQKSTVITSNVDPSAIPNREYSLLWGAMESRIREMCYVIEMDGPSFRIEGA